MNLNYLDFEQPIAELEAKIEELRCVGTESNINLVDEIKKLNQKSKQLTRSVFTQLTDWQIVQLARHPQRPYVMDYVQHIFTDFDELEGDRHYARGDSIVCGLARLDGQPVAVIGNEKGRTTKEKIRRNFGMPRPEDYRKAERIMNLAERFHLPLLTFVDTPGAYPGVGAEERNQSEAIAHNLLTLSGLKTPIIVTITGEGGSGGALAIGVGDRIIMLQYSIYSVISPEGCASILWKSPDKAAEATQALGVTANRLKQLKMIDEVLEEPLGGAHRNIPLMASRLKMAITRELTVLNALPTESLLAARYQRLLSYGRGQAEA